MAAVKDDDYSILEESKRILHDVLLADPRLAFPPEFSQAAQKLKFVGGGPDKKPFILTPLKMTESSSALTALLATAANVAASDRYGIPPQEVSVNVDIATLFLEAVLLPTVNGKSFLAHQPLLRELGKMDLHGMSKPIRRFATNVYKTRDGRWYHLHGSMNAGPTMEMMGVVDEKEGEDMTAEEAFALYASKVSQWDSQEIERVANEEFRQAGVVCYTPEEFFSSEQGKTMAGEPLWNATRIPGGGKAWPENNDKDEEKDKKKKKPLAGIRILDISRVIAAPAVSKMLASLGADVLRVSCDRLPEYAATMPDLQTGKRDVNLDLKTPGGKEQLEGLIRDGADVLIDGFRPGALGRLGFDSARLRELNPSLIYMRENCYGFKGPQAHRSGWQQISDCLVGLAHLQGQFLGLEESVVPLFPNSDYQTGLIGAAAVIQALIARAKEDVTFDIDISLTQYNIWYYNLGLYTKEQQEALRARDPEFAPRHYEDMQVLVSKTHQSLMKVRPDIAEHTEYFWDMSGGEYGIEEDIRMLAPAFEMGVSHVGWDVPSGRRGRSKAEWMS